MVFVILELVLIIPRGAPNARTRQRGEESSGLLFADLPVFVYVRLCRAGLGGEGDRKGRPYDAEGGMPALQGDWRDLGGDDLFC